jgi:hypothetical protein
VPAHWCRKHGVLCPALFRLATLVTIWNISIYPFTGETTVAVTLTTAATYGRPDNPRMNDGFKFRPEKIQEDSHDKSRRNSLVVVPAERGNSSWLLFNSINREKGTSDVESRRNSLAVTGWTRNRSITSKQSLKTSGVHHANRNRNPRIPRKPQCSLAVNPIDMELQMQSEIEILETRENPSVLWL